MNDIFNDNVSLKTETPAFAKHVLPAVPSSEVYLEDCVTALKRYADNHFDLAIVDPPYGLGNKLVDGGAGRNGKFDKNRDSVKWDILPNDEYFTELMRVSKNQIIWGSNYFQLPPTRCNLIWYKMQEFSGADFELAWTSFDKASKAFKMSRVEAYSDGKIHPCQKPIKLYEWILKNYANEGDLILDTHLGSGSSRIAAYKGGFNFVGFEIDQEYYNKQEKRFNDFKSQLRLF
jgi:site-specific DNA-methyltransferase (adenine-specific)